MEKPAVDTASSAAIEVLKTIRDGGLMFELSQKLEGVVRAVRETAKQGKVKINLTITPLTPGDGAGALAITGEVNETAPEKVQPITLFFSNEMGALSRKDPRQLEMEL